MLLLLITLFIGLALGAREADRVTNVPGLTPQPTFNHYAGYLNATNGNMLFYWFVESERNPSQDPVVLWLNGGPGCSSLTGFLIELGPWRVTPDGKNLTWFEQRWNKIANIIFLESPAGVGYSYNVNDEYRTDDDQTAYYNHMALNDFFAGFPEFRNNPFYVTGESYAGVYVPTLSSLLVKNAPDINFKGFAVGNGITDEVLMNNAMVPYEWSRGLFGTDTWNRLLFECCGNVYSKHCLFDGNPNPRCTLAMSEVYFLQWSAGMNPYNLYQTCYGGAADENGVIEETDDYVKMVIPESVVMPRQEKQRLRKFLEEMSSKKEVRASIPCTDTSDRETYLNNPDVRAALHVPESVHAWEACSSRVSNVYRQQYEDLTEFYNTVLDSGHQVLVFNGDLDMACNHLGDHWFVERLQRELVVPFQHWYYTDDQDSLQIAGFGEQWRNITFLSVLGAGHFVPTDEPLAAYAMWQGFLNNSMYWS